MVRKIVIILILLIAFSSSACASYHPSDNTAPVDPPPFRDDAFTPNEEGLFEVIIPENLLGGGTAESFVNRALTNQGFMEVITDVFYNNDGSATIVLTMEQLLEYRYSMHQYGQLHLNTNGYWSIKAVIYEKRDLTEITVWVDYDLYLRYGMDRLASNSVLAVYAGTFQILSGVAPDDWHTTITVRDYITDEIITSYYFPNENMYRSY